VQNLSGGWGAPMVEKQRPECIHTLVYSSLEFAKGRKASEKDTRAPDTFTRALSEFPENRPACGEKSIRTDLYPSDVAPGSGSKAGLRCSAGRARQGSRRGSPATGAERERSRALGVPLSPPLGASPGTKG